MTPHSLVSRPCRSKDSVGALAQSQLPPTVLLRVIGQGAVRIHRVHEPAGDDRELPWFEPSRVTDQDLLGIIDRGGRDRVGQRLQRSPDQRSLLDGNLTNPRGSRQDRPQRFQHLPVQRPARTARSCCPHPSRRLGRGEPPRQPQQRRRVPATPLLSRAPTIQITDQSMIDRSQPAALPLQRDTDLHLVISGERGPADSEQSIDGSGESRHRRSR